MRSDSSRVTCNMYSDEVSPGGAMTLLLPWFFNFPVFLMGAAVQGTTDLEATGFEVGFELISL